MQKGKFYEDKAVSYLKIKGYVILKRNFRSPFGEIDIIAKDKGYTCFIEVKARNHNYLVSGKEAIDFRKIEKIKKTALFYVSGNSNRFFRFDVLEIIQDRDFYRYDLIKGAFDCTDSGWKNR
ncbi:MAG: YraN family protein [Candidatus Omnitrophica bacterium]|jgi:putative endonuclease|nr:YraN family protein [Candidatus Omnitrophota bacterium]